MIQYDPNGKIFRYTADSGYGGELCGVRAAVYVRPVGVRVVLVFGRAAQFRGNFLY